MLSWRDDDATVSLCITDILLLKSFLIIFQAFFFFLVFLRITQPAVIAAGMQRIYTYPLPNGWKAIVEILTYNGVIVILRKNTLSYSFPSFLNKYTLLTNNSSHRMQDLANSL